MDESSPTTLYRLRDTASRLLYVGIAGNPGRRFEQHRKDKLWWGEVARIDLEHHPDRASAATAEMAAIKSEGPAYNIVGNNGRKASLTPRSCATGVWLFRRRDGSGRVRESSLELQWEINGTSYSHDEGIEDPNEAFEEWAKYVERHSSFIKPNGCITISWFVRGDAIFEGAPFRRPRPEWGDFLTHFTWPVNADTHEELNFFTLPLHPGKSWYIEPATGFRPGAFQQEVHFDTLVQNYWRANR